MSQEDVVHVTGTSQLCDGGGACMCRAAGKVVRIDKLRVAKAGEGPGRREEEKTIVGGEQAREKKRWPMEGEACTGEARKKGPSQLHHDDTPRYLAKWHCCSGSLCSIETCRNETNGYH
jgi:hypothetical protein